ncbi:hypothetical protein LIER_43509 [Lithospermum erythrorhizon]|uniref:Uncharacterized protein n=1 Tax=Lithospermum erythrorhizon TaxID=34254 RepID=A0AAV3Q8F0_LITER
MGDFIDILTTEEKEGGISRSEGSLFLSRDFVADCGLLDLGYVGQPFTWWNKRVGDGAIRSRLDRVLSDPQWNITFHSAGCLHIDMVGADRCPIMLDTNIKSVKSKRHFVFGSRWIGKEGCEDVSKNAWSRVVRGSRWFQVSEKIKLVWATATQSFCHATTLITIRRNHMLGIDDTDGLWREEDDCVEEEVLRYFAEIFSANDVCHLEKVHH